MKQYVYKYFGVFLLCLFCFATQGFAQESYLLKELRIPQVLQENPGAVVPYDAHISFPALGKVHMGANSPLSWGEMFYISDNWLKRKGKNNMIRFWLQDDIINLGFRENGREKNYFSIITTLKVDANVVFQKDLLALLIDGNTSPQNEKLSFVKNNFISVNSYFELGVGYNREVNENISFGLNVKYLLGILNAHTKKADLSLTTGENYHELVLDQNIQGKFACGHDLYYIIDVLQDASIKNPLKHLIQKTSLRDFKNHGFSVDVGGRYRINDMFEVNASVLDIGFIKWTSNPYQLNIDNKPFTFEGYNPEGDVLDNSNKDYFSKIKEYFKGLSDSLLNNFNTEVEESASYTKWLNTKVNIWASVYASPKDRLSLSFRGLFINNILIPSGSVSYTRNCGKWFDVVIGNTFKPNSVFNPGLGMNFTLNVFQLYAAVDYTNTLPYIDKVKNLNLIFGINFVAPIEKKKIKSSYPY